jgi:hypothetical protein
LGILFFSDHIRSLSERFDSKLADVEKPLSSAAWKVLVLTKDCPKSPTVNEGFVMHSSTIASNKATK